MKVGCRILTAIARTGFVTGLLFTLIKLTPPVPLPGSGGDRFLLATPPCEVPSRLLGQIQENRVGPGDPLRPVMRKHGRWKRWLLLHRWKTVRGSKRAELQALFAANRRLFKAYVLREQLDRLWTYKTRMGVLNFLNGWIDALRWQRLPEMDRLGEFLFKHLEGIAAYCDHRVRFGVVESINTTIKAVR